MKYDELLKILRECNDCICEEHCPYYEERNNPLKCMTKIVGDAADAIEELQKQILSADVAEVRRGKWIRPTRVPDSILSECSICGFDTGAFTFNYCPNCGSDMRKAGE